jgi:serine/threonine protein kinase
MKEIDVLKIVKHPNIIKLIESFYTNEYEYLVFELMEGKDLFDYLRVRNFSLSE